ncbi:MAG: major facilitator superfamily 1 [Bradyrhizobium sp.]|nr:major facilitator superfamily 1 [Bradyrhizobium sp.]
MILTFSVLALGFLVRPIGGFVIGAIGDRSGRRGVFIGSLVLTTFATLAIGLLPSYQSWGIAAPIALVALRLVQGFCLGGELPGAITFSVEAAPQRVGLACGFIFFCVNTGVLLTTFVNLGIQHWLPPEDVAFYGWRIAFLFGGVVGLVSYVMRRNLEESPVFLQMKAKHQGVRFPLRDLLVKYPKQMVVGIGTVTAIAGLNGILFGYMPAYLVQTLHYGAAETAFAHRESCLAVGVHDLQARPHLRKAREITGARTATHGHVFSRSLSSQVLE